MKKILTYTLITSFFFVFAWNLFAATTVPVNDPAIAAGQSPYNWYTNGSSYMQAVNPGAYIKTNFTGTSFGINVDVSGMVGTAAKSYPQVAYRVDNGLWQVTQLASTSATVILVSGLSAGTHRMELNFFSSDIYAGSNRWDGNTSLKITSFVLDNSSVLSNATTSSKRMMVFGDSITEGQWILGPSGNAASSSVFAAATTSYIYTVADRLGYEFGTASFAGQMWQGTSFGIPGLVDAWTFKQNGVSRLTGGQLLPYPDAVFVNMGTNGGMASSTVLSNWLIDVRSRVATTTKIFVLVPFNGSAVTTITLGFNNYVASSSDRFVYLVNKLPDSASFASGSYSTDGLHLNPAGNFYESQLVYDGLNLQVGSQLQGNFLLRGGFKLQ